jgi:chromosome segregation ATPase
MTEPVTTPDPTAGAQEGGQDGQTFEQIKAELAAVKEQNAKYSTALHTFTKRLDKFEAAARAIPDIDEHLTSSGAKPKAQATVAQKDDQSLRERVEKIESRERSLKEREKLGSIKSALIQHEIDATSASRLAKLIAQEQAEKLTVDDDLSVWYDDAGNPRSVQEWIRDYLQTDEGKFFLPPKRTTRNNSAANSTGAATVRPKYKREQLGALPIAELNAKNYDIISD